MCVCMSVSVSVDVCLGQVGVTEFVRVSASVTVCVNDVSACVSLWVSVCHGASVSVCPCPRWRVSGVGSPSQ